MESDPTVHIECCITSASNQSNSDCGHRWHNWLSFDLSLHFINFCYSSVRFERTLPDMCSRNDSIPSHRLSKNINIRSVLRWFTNHWTPDYIQCIDWKPKIVLYLLFCCFDSGFTFLLRRVLYITIQCKKITSSFLIIYNRDEYGVQTTGALASIFVKIFQFFIARSGRGKVFT